MSNRQHEEAVERINDAFRSSDVEGFLAACHENIIWEIAGVEKNTGKAAIREWMKQDPGCENPEFTVDRMISDGESVVCCGDMVMRAEARSTKSYSFCDVYRFERNMVANLRTFVVEIKPEGSRSETSGA